MAGSEVEMTVESICSMKSATARMSGTIRFIGKSGYEALAQARLSSALLAAICQIARKSPATHGARKCAAAGVQKARDRSAGHAEGRPALRHHKPVMACARIVTAP
ncbi:hypothetical protein GCM10007923_30410 [Shinella yambaruensis]|uniref:Transposase n=1 Tax=Shinella yambaruensis TaxID=415996 RepID=A0ABQ5ZIF4_9HYPH|nr:hypothetical protein GCM10007923_30410 [Shinella yambaruensis]